MSANNNTAKTEEGTGTQAMPSVVGVRFRRCGKIYSFRSDNIQASPGTKVVVESDMGISIGSVATASSSKEKPRENLKNIIRIATEDDFATVEDNRSLENEARAFCVRKAKEYNLQMKVVSTETTLDRKRLIFYFTADGRVDFRELVRDLAGKFKTRIEMRQIGVRDEVKMLGGIGACGRQTCCSQFLTSFEPVTIRMAKQQELSINQNKLSGICGRLMCCLGYEFRDAEEVAADRAERQEIQIVSENDTTEIVVKNEYPVAPLETPPLPESYSGGQEQKPVSPPEGEKPSEERKGRRKRRRKFKKFQKNAPAQEKPVRADSGTPPDKTTPAPTPDQQKKTDGDKGRPFSKRRKFWKKKRH